MAVIDEDASEVIRFQEFQNTPVSSAVIHFFIFLKINVYLLFYKCYLCLKNRVVKRQRVVIMYHQMQNLDEMKVIQCLLNHKQVNIFT